MYLPGSFELKDQAEIEDFMRRHDFATLVGPAGGTAQGDAHPTPEGRGQAVAAAGASQAMVATHLPVHLRRDAGGLVLEGHVARANPHWRAMDGRQPFLAIFAGPHAYVSPTWYSSGPAVPTWNYAVVHAHGTPRVRDDADFCRGLLAALTARYEVGPTAWRLEDLPLGFLDGLLPAIVGFEMHIDRLEAKFKLGQNRSAEDRAGAVAGLERAARPDTEALAELMRRLAP